MRPGAPPASHYVAAAVAVLGVVLFACPWWKAGAPGACGLALYVGATSAVRLSVVLAEHRRRRQVGASERARAALQRAAESAQPVAARRAR